MIWSGTTAGLIVKLKVFVAVCGVEQESVTRIWGLKEPEVLGVPEIRPPDESDTPVGNAPETNDQLSDPVPPVARS